MAKQKKQSFLYGASILMASMIIVKLIGAVFKIPLVNILHESGMGYFNTAYTLFTTVYALTVTGLSAGVARMVAENCAKGRYRDVKKLLKISTIIFIILGTLGFLIIALSAKSFSVSNQNPNSYWSVLMVAPSIFFCCIMASYRGYYEGLSDMKPTAITQIVEVVVKLITGLTFASIVMNIAMKQFADNGVVFGMKVLTQDAALTSALPFASAAAMLGVTVSTLAGFIYIFFRHKIKGDYITKQMIKESPPSRKTKVIIFRLIKISVPITLGAVVIQLSALIDSITIPQRLAKAYIQNATFFDNMYGSFLKENEEMNSFLFGCFSIVITIFNLVPAFTNIFGKSALPNVTEAWTTKVKSKIKVNIESVIRVTMLVAAPASFGIAFLSKPVLELLFKSSPGAVAVGGSLLTVLAIGAMFLSLVTPLNAIFQGIGRVDLPVKFLLTGAIIKLILNYTLVSIPTINVMGASISTVCCYFVIAFLSLTKLKKIVGVKLNFTSTLFKPLFCGFICGLSAFGTYKLLGLFMHSSVITVISIGVGGLFYIIFLGITNAIAKDDVLMLPKGKKIEKTLEKFKIIR
ncbi:MAG: polysaccharide biosynthesis protein [Oscillospiraceae bacterium]